MIIESVRYKLTCLPPATCHAYHLPYLCISTQGQLCIIKAIDKSKTFPLKTYLKHSISGNGEGGEILFFCYPYFYVMSANRASIDRVTNKDLKAHYKQFLLHFLQTVSQITNQGVIVLARLRKMRTSKQKLNADTSMQLMWCKIKKPKYIIWEIS